MDYLRPALPEVALSGLSNLALAHIGDAVYELMMRAHLACNGTQTAKNLHMRTTRMVCAGAQARAAAQLEPQLSEEEAAVFRRGRNAKPKSVPKSASCAEYAAATALEALFGWLYLKQRYDRINELFDAIVREAQ